MATVRLISRIKMGCSWVLACALLTSAHATEVIELSGQTMGTGFSLVLPCCPSESRRDLLSDRVVERLTRLEAVFSTWIDDSELSRFNRVRDDRWVPVSPWLADLALQSIDLHRATAGAFDPSVSALVELWGFAREGGRRSIPAADAQARALARVGLHRLDVRAGVAPALKKRSADLALDLSAVAKGYAVDLLVALLVQQGEADFLVEIGGEVRANGVHPGGRPWQVAVENPDPGSRTPLLLVPLQDAALATSGHYRNYRQIGGKPRSHLIDPRSGRPVEHRLIAVTVLADTALRADALTTALMVMGEEKGVAWAEQENLDALFVQAPGARTRYIGVGRFREWLATSRPD